MKRYKTWEVIKMITENSKLKFELVDICKNFCYLHSIIRQDGGCLVWQTEHENYLSFANFQGVVLIAEWELIQEPVTFMEAVNSGKKIRCEDGDEYCSLGDILTIVEEKFENTQRKMLNGKWFIEEEVQPNADDTSKVEKELQNENTRLKGKIIELTVSNHAWVKSCGVLNEKNELLEKKLGGNN